MATETKVKGKSSRKNIKFIVPAPSDAPINLQRAYARYITVEPIIILVAIGFGVMMSLLPQYFQHRIAMDMNVTLPVRGGGTNSTCVERNTSDPYYTRLQEVQAEVAYWQMIRSLCANVPALFISPLLGALGDVIGRKVVLGLTVFGYAFVGVVFLLVYYLMLPIWIIPASFAIPGNYHKNVLKPWN